MEEFGGFVEAENTDTSKGNELLGGISQLCRSLYVLLNSCENE
jgi:hypothetical protein